MSERVHFTGWVASDAIGDVLAGCDAYALPSMVETHSVGCVEGLLSGLPVVAFGAGPMDEYVDRSNGYLAAPDDEVDFTAGLRHVVEQRDSYDRLRIRGDAIHRFGVEAVASRLHDAYSAALSRDAGCEQEYP
jgi:glycosyltransferase involved in cell wall biosynthesis